MAMLCSLGRLWNSSGQCLWPFRVQQRWAEGEWHCGSNWGTGFFNNRCFLSSSQDQCWAGFPGSHHLTLPFPPPTLRMVSCDACPAAIFSLLDNTVLIFFGKPPLYSQPRCFGWTRVSLKQWESPNSRCTWLVWDGARKTVQGMEGDPAGGLWNRVFFFSRLWGKNTWAEKRLQPCCHRKARSWCSE